MRTLKQQLLQINIATTGTVVLVSLALMFTAELRTWKTALVQDMAIKADIIGNQCTAALVFSAPRDAEEVLNALRADDQIVSAAVYGRTGSLFADYHRLTEQAEVPGSAPPEGHLFEPDHLVLTRRIVLDEERIGSVSIRVGLARLRTVLIKYAVVSAAVLVFALAAAWVLLSRIQRSVTAPVIGLVHLMERVSEDKDYSRRAGRNGPQEFVSLAGSFNEMLAAVQSRDAELARSLAELKEAYGKLEDLDRMKSEFISTVSHELRTPITSIKAFLELLIIKRDMPAERKEKLLKTINSEIDRLSRLVGDLLDLSRIESGTMLWRDQDVDLDEVMRSVMDSVLPLARMKNIGLEGRAEPGRHIVHADRDRIVQVVMNLLSNAMKFTPAGGAISVILKAADQYPGVSLSVSDTGPGIPPEELSRIFAKFHRSGDVMTNAVEGTGLGLSISRQIVEHYDGTIWAASKRGEGSVFTFSLPFGRQASAPVGSGQ